MNSSEIEKKYRTYIKSSQGTVGMALVLTAIYLVRAMITGNFNFWFCAYTVEFFVKGSEFAPSLNGSISKPVCVAVVVVFIAVFAVMAVLSQKSIKWSWACFGIYTADTVFMLCGMFSGYFTAFESSQVIDIVFHAFVLVFIVVGILGHRGLKQMDLK